MSIEDKMHDAILEIPHGFSVKKHHFYLYPLTFGKLLLLQRHVNALEINAERFAVNSDIELLRKAEEKKTLCCKIIAQQTCKTKEEIFSVSFKKRVKLFERELDKEDVATLLHLILINREYEDFIKEFELDKEVRKIAAIQKVKNDKNSFAFNGRTLYGTFVDALCERYGWHMDYVVWGISYTNARMLLADKVVTLLVTDDERKKIPRWALSKDTETIKADNSKNNELIKKMDWK